METSYLKTLELDKIIARAAEGCVCKEAREKLLALREQQKENRRVCGNCYSKKYDGYVFVDAMGNIFNPRSVTANFSKLLEQNGLRHIRFHDLRHPYVKHTTKNISCKSRNPKPPTSGNLGFLFLLWFD